LAYLPSYRGVDLRVTASSLEETDAKSQADRLTEAIVSRIGDYIYTIGESSLPEVLGAILVEQGKTISTAESCTGGLVATMLTDIPGSSRYFLGSVVSYSNDVKERALRVPPELLREHGAVSSQVAEAMATGVRIAIGSDFSIAITGVAGPDGGTPEKPVGLVYVACAGPDFLISKKLSLFGTRKRIRERSAIMALDMLRRKLLEKPS
jgi:nicotinamide-nucleotide amidase